MASIEREEPAPAEGIAEETEFPDPATLDRLLAQWPRRPSEYRVPNLWLYRRRHGYRLLETEEGAWLAGVTYDGERHFLPFGSLSAGRAARILEHGGCIYPLEEEEARALCRVGDFRAEANPADSDYLYDARRLSRLDGAKTRRRQAAAFEQAHRPRAMVLTPETVPLALDVLAGWLGDVGRAPEATDLEECGQALLCTEDMSLSGMVVLADDRPAGFLLAGPLLLGERVIHFAKGRRALDGVYPWMFSRFAGLCGAASLNFEQDLGNPGLAQSKRAYAPVAQRLKYRLRRA